MARRRRLKSISVPITLGAITVPLSAALLVGWSVLLGQKIASSEDIAGDVWLLVLGAISFVVIIVVLVLFSFAVARGILEVRKQDSFIDSVTHELKSPLASLQLCLETLGRQEIAQDQREKLREMMLGDVDRLRSFIDDVLSANRLSYTRDGLLNLNDVNLFELVTGAVQAARSRHGLDQTAISIDIDSDFSLTTDRSALEIIVRNLIDNAIKYSEGEPAVHLRAVVEDKKDLLLEVKDQGIGIPPKDLKRVFHRFYRVGSDAVRERKGTGLGLFVVSALVRRLGGKVEALSDGLGQGATLRVVLPTSHGDRVNA